ncbi:AbrB family transcriptional regulator [Roseovarius sp. BRH_c41]|jgi:membrane AbrB-like protein|uniref:AbrB family transcriptional regulator n=1 Tax=Roseovarius sp. BRH_c41 TaxID=1629709 RepID=UPI0005F131BA|nr:AbrB family transcriptional regulator [Roseovarius sp. BRH_c41]KJS42182.1 MAG: aminopeptidase [Roseovarius sp. BRH_c41]
MPIHATTLLLLILSALSGFAGQAIGLPLPFLLGPLTISALIATVLPERLPTGYRFPQKLRLMFIAIIGLMIGAQVTPALFTEAHHYALTFGAVTLFVGLAHAMGYTIFRHLGGYDPTTAFYASTPGGLYESIELGEAAGADVTRLMMQQFLRIIVVVTALPLGLSLWLGAPVGSSAGMTMARPDVPWSDLPLIVLAGLGGLGLGHLLRLPAGQMTGPMALAAALSLSGWLSFDIPQWLVNMAQIVLGTALGMRFTGLSRSLLLRGAALALAAVGAMLTLGVGLALALHEMTGEAVDVLLITLAPGGVTEMALVALSLQANPAFVTIHHIYRIVLTVLTLGVITRLRQRQE